ncbi:DUF551 domain-containing protein [Enterobacter sp. I4]|uniref:DUF551 domain-containing protein n=1 Tax=Enterobacter sp. I4 TaxID=2926672 RepID=UPI001F595147|nr:DUF551 domain-containing protein [Enterobacter sp. I4]MCI2290956.1 DUF551 domain-containing protein [Enterobacter sp. I4]
MSTFTKEWLQQKIAHMEAARDEIPFGLDEDDSNTLAALRITLASLEARSRKLFTCSACGAEGLDEPLESKCHCNEDGAHWIESVVYTAPPAPVSVPDELTRVQYKRRFMEDDDFDDTFRGGWNACRAAMLQGAENSESRCTIQAAPALDSSPKNAGSRCGKAPVIQDAWVACSERMPNDKDYVWCWGRVVGWTEDDGFEAYYDASRNKWWAVTMDGEEPVRKVTHWQPLPSPPAK